MRNTSLSVILFLLSASLASAQYAYGIKTGMNASIFNGLNGNKTDYDFKTGSNFGFYMKSPMSRKIYFRAELYYSSQGRKDYDPYYYFRIDTKTSLNYVNIPLLFEFGRVVSFQAGPQVGVLLSAHERGTIQGMRVDENLRKFIKPIDVGVVAGLNVNLGESFSLGLRFNSGLSEIFRSDYVTETGNKNYTFHLYAGLLIKGQNFKKSDNEFLLETQKPSLFSFGIKGGLNLDNTSYRNPPDGYVDVNQNSLGAHIGLYFRLKLGRRMSLTHELQYIQKQSKLRSIETPFILSYLINSFLDIEAGPQAGLLMKPRVARVGLFEKDYFFLDYGLNGGVRFRISKRMALTCRYYHGLQDIINLYDNTGVKLPTQGYNRNLLVSLYFKPGKIKK